MFDPVVHSNQYADLEGLVGFMEVKGTGEARNLSCQEGTRKKHGLLGSAASCMRLDR
jgi:hypothetical protein